MINASVYVITLNEEQHMKRMLESVKEFNEVIIVDSGSTDRTLEIARKYTDKIYHQEWLGFSKQKELARKFCAEEWVLNLDADEELSSELKAEIIRTIKDGRINGLDIQISSKYLGKFNHPLVKYNRRIRFFRRLRGHYPEKMVHESISVEGSIKKAKGFIFDYGTQNIKTHIGKINEYSSLRAAEKFHGNKKASLIKLILVFPLAFFKSLILKRGVLNGVRGLIAAMNNAYYAFLKEAKLYEMNQNKTDS